LHMLTRLGILALLLVQPSLFYVQVVARVGPPSSEPFRTSSLQERFDFDLTVLPSGPVMTFPGGNFTFSVEAKLKNGTPELVNLLAVGLPPASTWSFSPESGIPDPLFLSTLTIITSYSTPVGAYSVEIQATSKELTRTARVPLAVVAAPADFALLLSPNSRSVVQGESTTYVATITVIGALFQPILLAPAGLPAGVDGYLEPQAFRPTPSKMSHTSILHVSTDFSATPGEYVIQVVATSAGLARTAETTLIILYSDPFRQCWQTLSKLPDAVWVGIIGAAALIIAATIGRTRAAGKKDQLKSLLENASNRILHWPRNQGISMNHRRRGTLSHCSLQ